MARWSDSVDLYCERVDASFWAEPVNALTNLAFIIAAVAALVLWSRLERRDWPVLALIGVTFAVGAGSFAFHTLATRGAILLDVIPISAFVYGYFLLALRRFLQLAWGISIPLVVAFVALSFGLEAVLPRGFLNGSGGYLPPLAAMLVIGFMVRRAHPLILTAAAIFAVSLFLRTIDRDVCAVFSLGTHFGWHLLNGLTLYVLLRAAMDVRRAAGASSAPA